MTCPQCGGRGYIVIEERIDACPTCARAAEIAWKTFRLDPVKLCEDTESGVEKSAVVAPRVGLQGSTPTTHLSLENPENEEPHVA